MLCAYKAAEDNPGFLWQPLTPHHCRVQMGNATTFDVSAALAAADAAPGRPGLMLSVLPLAQECYGQDERRQRFRCPDPSVSPAAALLLLACPHQLARDHTPCAAARHQLSLFRPCPQSPCTRTGAPALSLGGPCAMHLPVSDRGAVGLVHFVRNPWDVVVSALWFHLQQPAPEAWIDKEAR